MRLIGDFPAKTDAKGRVFLPAALRKMLDAEGVERLVLRNDLFQHCLTLYPEPVWDALLADLKSRLNPWSSKDQMMLRQFVVDAEPVELDSNGRFLISKRKLQYAEIEADVRFVAVDDKIEVWSKQKFEELMGSVNDVGGNLDSRFGNE